MQGRLSRRWFLCNMAVLLLAVVSIGSVGLMFFWGKFLEPGQLGAVSLPLVAFVAGVAAIFNPCALSALQDFLTWRTAMQKGGYL